MRPSWSRKFVEFRQEPALKMGTEVGIGSVWTGKWIPLVPRTLYNLTPRRVAVEQKPGRHADGGGLYLRVTKHGAKSWVFMTSRGGTRIEVGLGAAAHVTLADVRRIAGQMREVVASGGDPRRVLNPEVVVDLAKPTFGQCAADYIASKEASWRNEVHRQQWRNSLRDHASGLRDMPIDQIETEHVVAVLQPIWTSKQETARRVRGRIEKILDAARVKKLRPTGDINPATWRGHLEHLLSKPKKLSRGHHAALPFADAPEFMAELRERPALAARCLEFLILTAARSGEVLGATWEEVDLDAKLWIIPKERMKAGIEHAVPLSEAAASTVEALASKDKRTGNLFSVGGAAKSNMAMSMLLRRMGRAEITVHGFRSTFRDWAGDRTSFPRELIEHALAHKLGDSAEQAYRRTTAIERRRELMLRWSSYLAGGAERTNEPGR